MILYRKLLIAVTIMLITPLGIGAQQKQHKFEINVGVSTPGLVEMQGTKFFNMEFVESGDYYLYDKHLSELDKEVNYHTPKLCYSIEMAYKLAESGFFKRLDLVGFSGLHSANYERFDKVNRTTIDKEIARKLDILMGIRFNILKNEQFNMYTQFLVGGSICDNSRFWDDISEESPYGKDPIIHFTFLGFNWSGDSGLGALVELGFGTEYALNMLFPFFPGIRAGLSYRF